MQTPKILIVLGSYPTKLRWNAIPVSIQKKTPSSWFELGSLALFFAMSSLFPDGESDGQRKITGVLAGTAPLISLITALPSHIVST